MMPNQHTQADRDQRQRLSTWDLMVQTAKTPLEKKEIRDVHA